MKTSALFTDLYELIMAQAYAAEHMDQVAVFELTFRQMPKDRNYIVAAGIGDGLEFFANFRSSSEELDYLRPPASSRLHFYGSSKMCGSRETFMQFRKPRRRLGPEAFRTMRASQDLLQRGLPPLTQLLGNL